MLVNEYSPSCADEGRIMHLQPEYHTKQFLGGDRQAHVSTCHVTTLFFRHLRR